MTRVPRRAITVPALAVPLVLAACGGTASSMAAGVASSGASSGAPSGSSSGSSACSTARTITVKGSQVTPPPSTVDVKAGCPVRLTVTADRSSVVHVHVVDIETRITAGKPTSIAFTPTQSGVYEVELHDPDLLLVKLAVR